MRYIDADALLEIIDHYILHDEDARKHHSALFIEGMKDGYYRIKSKVLNVLTADVVSKEKYDKLNDRYHRLLENATILAKAINETDDLINREDAIEAIKKSAEKYTGFMAMEMYTVEDALEAIASLPKTERREDGEIH